MSFCGALLRLGRIPPRRYEPSFRSRCARIFGECSPAARSSSPDFEKICVRSGSMPGGTRLHAEQLLILIKDACAALPEGRQLLVQPDRASTLNQLISMAVEEYFSTAKPAV